jgi:hypothetical protein
MISAQGGQPERQIGRFLKPMLLGRRRVVLVVRLLLFCYLRFTLQEDLENGSGL